MSTSFQTPPVAQRPVPLHKATLPGTEFVDRNDETWVPAGHTESGELVLACPEPANEGDRGEGASYRWTLHEVQHSFGPLIARSAVSA
ncbi:hypothetical protein O3S80_04175 [Streptomyces sp. Lzd4kr]|nr:hypothetical protein [Streptomyces sp. Lzd4kr]